jgi:hypothetical protein
MAAAAPAHPQAGRGHGGVPRPPATAPVAAVAVLPCSTPKISTSRAPSSHKGQSTTFSFGATSQTRALRTFKSFGQTSHPRRSTPTHRVPRVGAHSWSRLTRQRDRVPALDARSVGDDSSKGAQGCSPRPASESRRHTWPHCQTLPTQHGSCRRPSQDVFKVPSFNNDRDQVPWFLEHKIRLEVVSIRSEANLADAPSRQRGLDMWSLHPRSKNSCAWSSQHWARKSAQTLLPADRARLLQDLPHLCTVVTVQPSTACSSIGLNPSRSVWLNPPWHLLPQVLEKLRASRARGILVYPYWPLQPWFQEVQRLSAFHFSLPPPRLCASSSPSSIEKRSAGSGLRLCVKDHLLQADVLLASQGDNSRIRWSLSQEWLLLLLLGLKIPTPPGVKWTGHSLRRGVASTAHAIGASSAVIMAWGLWKSRASALLHMDVVVRPSSEPLFFFGHLLPRFLLMEAPIVRQAQPTAEASSVDLSDAMDALFELSR